MKIAAVLLNLGQTRVIISPMSPKIPEKREKREGSESEREKRLAESSTVKLSAFKVFL